MPEQLRCHQYWPDKGNQLYGNIVVSLADVISLAHCTIRTFNITLVNDCSMKKCYH